MLGARNIRCLAAVASSAGSGAGGITIPLGEQRPQRAGQGCQAQPAGSDPASYKALISTLADPGAVRTRGRQVRCRQFAGLSTFPAGVVNSSPFGPGGQDRRWARSAAATAAGSGMTRHDALVLGGANNGRDAASGLRRVVAGR